MLSTRARLNQAIAGSPERVNAFFSGKPGTRRPGLFGGRCAGLVRDRNGGQRRHVADARVPMLVVVPIEEGLAMRSGILDTTEVCGKVGPVLHRLELRLGVRIVVKDVGSAVALGDVQVHQQGGYRFGPHRCTPVRVRGEHAALQVVTRHAVGDELLGQLGTPRSATSQPATWRLKISRITYKWKQAYLAGPFNLVISHDQTWLG